MDKTTTQAIREKLRHIFDYDQFREEQEAIIKNVLERKNTFVIMPTGGGKSLCYQIPALMQEGVAIVISPLIALMKNQVDQLRALGVKAAFVNSTLSKKLVQSIREEVLAGTIKLLYVAPESLIKAENLAFLKQAPISFIAIDEAHCISDWGHDFRPEYRNIKTVIDKQLGALPVIGLTATATPKVQQDILRNLEMEDAVLFKSSFNRDNLYYEVRPKVDVEKQLVKFIKDKPNAIGIVYCQSRKKAEELAALLSLNDIRAAPYHAGLESKVRMKNQDAFLNNQLDVMVATIAFGMGIDKPDVRFVVHYDVPRALEGYYQETGRAGRDGLASHCLMFYSPEDMVKMKKFNNSKSAIERVKAHALLQEVDYYALSGVCRRKQLLYYFGEVYETDCQRCDNCQQPTETYEGVPFVSKILAAAQQTEEQYGINHLIHFLRGTDDAYIKSAQHDALTLFGQGSEQTDTFWMDVIRQMLMLGLLHKGTESDSPLQLTEQGRSFLAQPHTLMLCKDHVYTTSADTATAPVEGDKQTDPILLKALKALRDEIAKERGIPAYAVFQDASLEDMALAYPTTLATLAQASALSSGKASKFGKPFIALIQQYIQDHDIATVSEITIKSIADKSKNKVAIIQQIDRKIALQEIAASKSLTLGELFKEMEQLCYAGTKLDLGYHINTILSTDQQEELYDYFMTAETDSLEEAQATFGDEYSEDELRLMRIKFMSEVAN